MLLETPFVSLWLPSWWSFSVSRWPLVPSLWRGSSSLAPYKFSLTPLNYHNPILDPNLTVISSWCLITSQFFTSTSPPGTSLEPHSLLQHRRAPPSISPQPHWNPSMSSQLFFFPHCSPALCWCYSNLWQQISCVFVSTKSFFPVDPVLSTLLPWGTIPYIPHQTFP